MGTHCVYEVGSVDIYRHYDGYVAEGGADLLRFIELERSGKLRNGSRVGDSEYLAARLVAFLADKFREEGAEPTDFLSLGVAARGADFGEEYRYRVEHNGDLKYKERKRYLDGYAEGGWGEWQPLTDKVVERAVAVIQARIKALTEGDNE